MTCGFSRAGCDSGHPLNVALPRKHSAHQPSGRVLLLLMTTEFKINCPDFVRLGAARWGRAGPDRRVPIPRLSSSGTARARPQRPQVEPARARLVFAGEVGPANVVTHGGEPLYVRESCPLQLRVMRSR
jgi:hypothetical protein